jgi:hypothetical protein
MLAHLLARVAAERRVLEEFFMRCDRWPKWAGRRAPTGTEGTARTLAGSVRYGETHYTGNGKVACDAARRRSVYSDTWHCLPEPCGHAGFPPSPKRTVGGLNARCGVNPFDFILSGRTHVVSCVPIVGDFNHGKDPRHCQLLAVHELRRSVERVPNDEGSTCRVPMAMTAPGMCMTCETLRAAG